jgi:predicted CXXCH cytochrome family protein
MASSGQRTGGSPGVRSRRRMTLGSLGLLVLLGALACGPSDPDGDARSATPAGAGEAREQTRFVTSQACRECHAEQFAQWRGSHHDRAMQPATAETVLGDFDDASFGQFPVLTRFFRRGDGYWVNTEGPEGEPADFEVKYTFGVEPLQQYLVEFPGGRLQSLTVAWDTQRQRWFSLYPDERIASDDPLHWTGRYQRWNSMCADCHSTELRRGYDVAADRYETTWAELDVGCEACHGPGSRHVAWAEAAAAEQREPSGDPALVVDFAAGDARREIEICAPCHSRRHRLVESAEIGAPFLDGYAPDPLREGLYHADGQVDGEVYVYGSFLQSAMHRRGVRCGDCHEPHALGLRAEGNALCVRCHSPVGESRFPTLVKKVYDAPEHHFHPAGSSGADCVACHMPAKTFMEIDVRHDHSLRVPRPDLSQALGTPDACTLCHVDRDDPWAAAAVAQWYGPERRQGFHYGAVFHAARAGYREVLPGLVETAGDPELPAIVRATAVELLEAHAPAPEALGAIVAATRDEDAFVRATAVASLDRMPPEQRTAIALPLLDDPVRAVRVEVGRVLAGVPAEQLSSARQRSRDAAVAEYEAAQRAAADTAAAHLNLGVLHVDRGELVEAEAAYRKSIEIGPDFLPAHFNLATFYNQTQRNAEAERVFREALQQFPEEGELHYSLGLLLAEEQRLPEAAESLRRASELLPTRARVHYNLALALQHLDRREEAETVLQQAHRSDTRDPGIVNALAIFYLQDENWVEARLWAQRLVDLAPPGAPGPQQLLRRIESEAAGGGAAASP